jgi:hypothetical protein
MTTSTVLHAVFNDSAAGCLKQALRLKREWIIPPLVQWSERVSIDQLAVGIIPLRDDLSIGPIGRPDGESRSKWVREELRLGPVPPPNADVFWAQVASPANRIVAWVSRRSAREYSGLLALVSQREDRPLDIVDVTEIEFLGDDGKPDPERSRGIGGVAPTQIIDLKLADRAVPLPTSTASRYRQTWTQLQQENALLRVVDGDDLVSVPITHFDSRIVSSATPEWENTKKVIGAFFRSAAADGLDRPDSWFVRSRIMAMVEAGVLDGKGDFDEDPPHSKENWVRRPSNATNSTR